MSADAPAVMGVAEIAEFLGIRKPNVRKTLDAYEVEPIAELAVGPVYARLSIESVKERRASEVAAGVDRTGRRRASR